MRPSGAHRGLYRLAATVVAAVVVTELAGCGGSSSSAERANLTKQVSAQLQSGGAPQDVVACVGEQARGLPLDQLRAVANAGSNPPPATKAIGVRLLTTCISQGKGISALHALLVQSILHASSGTPLPAAYRNCVATKAGATTPSQLSQMISAYASGGQAAAEAQGQQLGRSLGRQCFGDPAVLAGFRAVFVDVFKRGFATAHYSNAFKNCMLQKAEAVPSSLLKRSALDPSGATAAGEAFGREAAQRCIASGIKP